ncbi:MAG: 50S ribosomal protein L10 [Bacilli bacterium]|nr:50S ribosomal protein L10 [Bacilli bacterium]
MNQAVLAAKSETVKEISEKAKKSQTIIVCEYRGLTVAQIQEVRRALHKENAEMNVYKNSLVERAVDELGYNDLNSILTGPNAIVFSEDVIAGAKVIAKYAKRHRDILVVKGGIVEGKFVDAKGIIEVSKLPGKEGLISMFLSCLQAPIRSFACAVKAVADK